MKSTGGIEFVLNWLGGEKNNSLSVPSYLFLGSVKNIITLEEEKIIVRTVFK